MDKANSRSMIYLSIVLAMMLAILPLPAQLDSFRPDWLTLVVLYWVLALPHRVNVGTAWVAGLILDILLGSTLGVRALGLAVITYVCAMNYQLIRNFSVWQQAVVIGVLTVSCKLLIFWAEHLVSDIILVPQYFWSIISTMLIWPWVFLILRPIRRRFGVT